MRHEHKVALWTFGPVFVATAIAYVGLTTRRGDARHDGMMERTVQADQVVEPADEATPEPTPEPTPDPSPSPEFYPETTAEFNFGWTAGYNQARLEWEPPCAEQSTARNKEQYRQMTLKIAELRRVIASMATPTPTPVPLSGPRR